MSMLIRELVDPAAPEPGRPPALSPEVPPETAAAEARWDDAWARRTAVQLTADQELDTFLEHLPAGPGLARLLAVLDPDDLDTYALVEFVAAHKRMEAHHAAQAARSAAALSQRPELSPARAVGTSAMSLGECLAGDELAMRLGLTRFAGRRLAMTGRLLNDLLDSTGEMLAAGELDYAKAETIATRLAKVDPQVAVSAELEVLPRAAKRTRSQLIKDLERAVISVDPDEADFRHRAARAERRVNHPRPLGDGMASIYSVLPAADAIAMDMALEAAARAAKNNGDRRTLDQLRADSFSLMGHAALATGYIGPHGNHHEHSERSGGDVDDDVRPAPAVGNVDDGACPAPPEGAAEVRMRSDPSAVGSRGELCHPPGGSRGAPSAPAPEASRRAQRSRPAQRPRPTQAPPRTGERFPNGRLPRVRLGMIAGGRVSVRVTVPLNVAMPPDPNAPELHTLDRVPEDVAEIEGYGAIPPEVARALAAGDTWQRLVTDPGSGAVLDVGRTRYQPPAELARYVRERDRTCVRPGCSVPARSCDLDHNQPWHSNGDTAADNLGALCPPDHRLKTIGVFSVEHRADGSFDWTTPSGHAYRRHADGSVMSLPRRAGTLLREAAEQAGPAGVRLGVAAAGTAPSDADGDTPPF